MKAPMSPLVKRILSDRKLSKRLMEAVQCERRYPDDIEGRTIEVDGRRFTLSRASAHIG